MKLPGSVSCSAALAAFIVVCAAGSAANAGVAQTQVGPATQTYSNGGGAGFGGTLGAGSISFGVSGGNLNISFAQGNALNDLAVIMLDTHNGGFTDSELSDLADGGRRACSSPSRDGLLLHPAGMTTYAPGGAGGTADYGLAIGSFGSVLFELVPGSLNFLFFNAAPNISIPLGSIANPSTIDWFAYYTADSQFLSNESMPAFAVLNGGANPGFGPGVFALGDYNRYLVPAPGAAALLGLGGLIAGRRRRH